MINTIYCDKLHVYKQNPKTKGSLVMLQQLSDDLLLEAYDRAIQHCLNADFISIIKQELRRRGLLKHIHMKKDRS